ncbi:metal-dependent transcriptional regulator [Rhodococcus sp. IEGM 1351]|uniref:metal-dependent transcriptional regulator n=1 Tax=Rhodococcus sp. IEGM 1351 TaxID=3047089 RepID=UPI0024B85B27|nr:metal-dependent transcriptional regulator [Rhodococcus sp. IEGM 1351]MDI9938901.1 metal-dependent transcriptional regulator [Rhodococcus sp. IEGM 1351]
MPSSVMRTPSQCCGSLLTAAVEDYLRTLFCLSARGEATSTSALARCLDLATSTVSNLHKRSADAGLIRRPGPHRVTLTAHGQRHAVKVLRRNRLAKTFLVESLGMSWDEIGTEADVLEHAISPRLESRLTAALGNPTHDPYGNPIPPATGEYVESWPDSLSAVVPCRNFTVERVVDRDAEGLRLLAGLGIYPGRVLARAQALPHGGPVCVEIDEGHPHELSAAVSGLIYGRAA